MAGKAEHLAFSNARTTGRRPVADPDVVFYNSEMLQYSIGASDTFKGLT